MTTEQMIKELRRLEEKHKDDFVPTCSTNWSLLCHDVANRLEELSNKSCTGRKHSGKRENEVECGYNSPCVVCCRRANDNYRSE